MKNREEKVKNFRILEIDQLIREGNFPNATTLRKKFEVSRSTIARDIEFLRDRYNAPIEFDPVKNGYYYTDPTFFIKNIMLTEGELFTVSAIMPLLEQYKNTPLENSFKTILGKMIDMLPNQVSVDSSFVSDDISFISDPLPKIEESIFNAIFKGIKTRHSLEFDYKSLSKQEYSKRVVHPYHVVCQKGNWYFLGFAEAQQDVRIYALSRMKNVCVTSSTFTFPKDFSPDNYIDKEQGVWISTEKPIKIELVFDSSINTYILERTWHQTQTIHQNEDGSVHLSFMTNQLHEIFHWVLSFGSNVQVLNPPELKEKIIEEAKKILGTA